MSAAATAIAPDYFSRIPLQRHPVQNSLHNFTQRPQGHQSSSSVVHPPHPETYDVENGMSYRLNGRIEQEQLPIDKLSERDLAKKVSQALLVDFGNLKATNKEVARASRASLKSAENWTQGHNTPSLLPFLRLFARSPALQAEVRRLTAMEADLDPDFQQQILVLLTRMQRGGG